MHSDIGGESETLRRIHELERVAHKPIDIDSVVAKAIAAERQRLCVTLRKAAEKFERPVPPGVALLALAEELENT